MTIKVGGGFSTGFSTEFQVVMDSVSASFDIPISDILITDVIDWKSCQPNFNSFNRGSDCKSKEREFYSGLVSDAINTAPVPVNYYVVDYNVDYDKLFGEDRDRTILRKFVVNTTFNLPTERDMITIDGIEGLDSFHMYSSISHFTLASTYSDGVSAVHPVYVPKVGDIIQAQYNELYYRILNVKKTTEQFLQKPHTWDFLVSPYRDNHLNLSDSISADDIGEFVNQDDYLQINDFIDDEVSNIIITSSDDILNGITPPNDPFGGW
jgi:hypothetical protein